MYTRGNISPELRVCVRLNGHWSYKLLGGRNCLFYAIRDEEVSNVFAIRKRTIEKGFSVPFYSHSSDFSPLSLSKEDLLKLSSDGTIVNVSHSSVNSHHRRSEKSEGKSEKSESSWHKTFLLSLRLSSRKKNFCSLNCRDDDNGSNVYIGRSNFSCCWFSEYINKISL